MTWLKLLIPLGLGLAAGIANYVVLTGKTTRTRTVYMTVNRDIQAGQTFKKGQFGVLEIEEEAAGQLSQAAIRYADRATLYDRPCRRNLKAGDLVLHQDVGQANWEQELEKGESVLPFGLEGITNVEDLIAVGSNVGFFILGTEKSTTKPPQPNEQSIEYVGPFRVVGIGTRVDPLALPGRSGGGESKVLSLAVKLNEENQLDQQAQRLLMTRRTETERGQRLFLSVVLHPNR